MSIEYKCPPRGSNPTHPAPTDHQPGATAHVYTEMGDTKRLAAKGHVTALRSDLEREGRMARLIIVSIQPPEREVEAPLTRKLRQG